jgi:hypothetical protein
MLQAPQPWPGRSTRAVVASHSARHAHLARLATAPHRCDQRRTPNQRHTSAGMLQAPQASPGLSARRWSPPKAPAKPLGRPAMVVLTPGHLHPNAEPVRRVAPPVRLQPPGRGLPPSTTAVPAATSAHRAASSHRARPPPRLAPHLPAPGIRTVLPTGRAPARRRASKPSPRPRLGLLARKGTRRPPPGPIPACQAEAYRTPPGPSHTSSGPSRHLGSHTAPTCAGRTDGASLGPQDRPRRH